MAIAVAGYSGKPLAEKLGIRDGMAAAFVALPASLRELKQAAKLALCESFPDWRAVAGVGKFDFIQFAEREVGDIYIFIIPILPICSLPIHGRCDTIVSGFAGWKL